MVAEHAIPKPATLGVDYLEPKAPGDEGQQTRRGPFSERPCLPFPPKGTRVLQVPFPRLTNHEDWLLSQARGLDIGTRGAQEEGSRVGGCQGQGSRLGSGRAKFKGTFDKDFKEAALCGEPTLTLSRPWAGHRCFCNNEK